MFHLGDQDLVTGPEVKAATVIRAFS